MSDWGGKATLSFSFDSPSWLWDCLAYSLPPLHWRAAKHKSGWIASVHAMADDSGKRIYKQIVTTSFVVRREQVTESSDKSDMDTVSTNMPAFTEAELEKMKVAELRGICKKYNIKQGKRKAEYIQHIVCRSATVHQQLSDVQQLCSSLSSSSLTDPAPPHDFCGDWFNLVDLADRKWYSVEDHHAHQEWKCKLILAILRFATINAWVQEASLNFAEWKSWRDTLASQLMIHGLNIKSKGHTRTAERLAKNSRK